MYLVCYALGLPGIQGHVSWWRFPFYTPSKADVPPLAHCLLWFLPEATPPLFSSHPSLYHSHLVLGTRFLLDLFQSTIILIWCSKPWTFPEAGHSRQITVNCSAVRCWWNVFSHSTCWKILTGLFLLLFLESPFRSPNWYSFAFLKISISCSENLFKNVF